MESLLGNDPKIIKTQLRDSLTDYCRIKVKGDTMKEFLEYKDYLGSVHFNVDDEIFYGKIECIDDLISFEGNTVNNLKTAFIEAVEDYIELCKEAGKPAEKSYKGSFNIRISPAIHKKAKRQAIMQGISLNQFIQQAVEQAVTYNTRQI